MDVKRLESVIEGLSNIEEEARAAQFEAVNIKDELTRLIRDIRELKDEVQGEFEEWVD